MVCRNENPLIVQSDGSILAEADNPLYPQARDTLMRFAELVKSPEQIHTYQMTPLSLWNAAAAGESPERIVEALTRYSKYELPGSVVARIHEYMARYGKIRLVTEDGQLVLRSDDQDLILRVAQNKRVAPFILRPKDPGGLLVDPAARGAIKQALVQVGYPVEDLAGYLEGTPLPLRLRRVSRSGVPFQLRPYQMASVEAFWSAGSYRGGSGVIVLPCGAGKTLVGIAVMAKVQSHTLILCPNTVAVHQWIFELLDKTTLRLHQIGEYTGEIKQVRPITVTTYQMLTHRGNDNGRFPHFDLFTSRNWGLIIYDEVHLLPAPIFRITAEIQARRRLGLTATLVREDGRETDVFSLIGPKRYDVPWKELESQGWIASAECVEVRVDLPRELRAVYARNGDIKHRYRLAAENPLKLDMVQRLLQIHCGDKVLIIGQYLNQLQRIAQMVGAPIVTGATTVSQREALYERFRSGDLSVLVVSKVANFSIDLPDANVAIQVSGTFGSRQEEAQRLGRILRPKANGRPARFYSLVTRDTKDQEFSAKRQLFLTEQGYRYTIVDASALGSPASLTAAI
jgi:DNA excision repair protein ERCC-3